MGQYLASSVHPAMHEKLRRDCLEVFRELILKYEPVAQVLLIRRIISLIMRDSYEYVG